MYDRLGYIFGKDRATGVAAETPADAVEDLNDVNENINLDDINPEPFTSQPSSIVPNPAKQKRKRNSDG